MKEKKHVMSSKLIQFACLSINELIEVHLNDTKLLGIIGMNRIHLESKRFFQLNMCMCLCSKSIKLLCSA